MPDLQIMARLCSEPIEAWLFCSPQTCFVREFANFALTCDVSAIVEVQLSTLVSDLEIEKWMQDATLCFELVIYFRRLANHGVVGPLTTCTIDYCNL